MRRKSAALLLSVFYYGRYVLSRSGLNCCKVAASSDLIAKAPGALAAAGVKCPDRTVYYMERR